MPQTAEERRPAKATSQRRSRERKRHAAIKKQDYWREYTRRSRQKQKMDEKRDQRENDGDVAGFGTPNSFGSPYRGPPPCSTKRYAQMSKTEIQLETEQLIDGIDEQETTASFHRSKGLSEAIRGIQNEACIYQAASERRKSSAKKQHLLKLKIQQDVTPKRLFDITLEKGVSNLSNNYAKIAKDDVKTNKMPAVIAHETDVLGDKKTAGVDKAAATKHNGSWLNMFGLVSKASDVTKPNSPIISSSDLLGETCKTQNPFSNPVADDLQIYAVDGGWQYFDAMKNQFMVIERGHEVQRTIDEKNIVYIFCEGELKKTGSKRDGNACEKCKKSLKTKGTLCHIHTANDTKFGAVNKGEDAPAPLLESRLSKKHDYTSAYTKVMLNMGQLNKPKPPTTKSPIKFSLEQELEYH